MAENNVLLSAHQRGQEFVNGSWMEVESGILDMQSLILCKHYVQVWWYFGDLMLIFWQYFADLEGKGLI